MRANCWTGRNSVEVLDVAEPRILSSRDAIVKVTSTAICGSDLHLYDGYVPTMRKGDIIGHEFMGEVVETGADISELTVGDRVVVPFPIACGACNACERGLTSVCENSNPNAGMAEKLMGHSPCGIFGYSHLLGGYPGGQAEYVRVPFADVGPFRVDGDVPDERVLFLTDVLPTGYMAAEMCEIGPGDVVAVWGAGPVGQFAVASAKLLGAERVIVIDQVPERLRLAATKAGATDVIDYSRKPVLEALNELTAGRGPDACIDAVGMEARAASPLHAYDRVKQASRLETERPHALREAILACRSGGVVSVVGVYGGFMDKFPIGAFMNRSLRLRTGQTHVHRYLAPLMDRIDKGEIDPSFIITHTLPLDEAPAGFEMFKHKRDGCIKVVLKP